MKVVTVSALTALVIAPFASALVGSFSSADLCCHQNYHRLMGGLPLLRHSASLATMADGQAKAQALQNDMTHDGATAATKNLAQRIALAKQLGDWVNGKENIGFKYNTTRGMTDAWMASPPHHETLMFPSSDMVCGGGHAISTDGTDYWTADFAMLDPKGDQGDATKLDCSAVYASYGMKAPAKPATTTAKPVTTTPVAAPAATTTTPAAVTTTTKPAATATVGTTTPVAATTANTTPVANTSAAPVTSSSNSVAPIVSPSIAPTVSATESPDTSVPSNTPAGPKKCKKHHPKKCHARKCHSTPLPDMPSVTTPVENTSVPAATTTPVENTSATPVPSSGYVVSNPPAAPGIHDTPTTTIVPAI
ncbi:hypothetical protein IWQ60_008175 [Tieghemiomyces parasiticus]|uniref:SCP domain-containing protein n=1 Tax=Tieghemiomyces parasiticus TaxID=78921 RepID=A0A9W7ZU70_9FUNG|nr:hypothetical protein IWQ60_008175 [Tieghemiomyces parasiticus]